MSAQKIPDQVYLMIGGHIYKPQPGFMFRISEVQKPLSDEEMRQVGQPGWPHRADA